MLQINKHLHLFSWSRIHMEFVYNRDIYRWNSIYLFFSSEENPRIRIQMKKQISEHWDLDNVASQLANWS